MATNHTASTASTSTAKPATKQAQCPVTRAQFAAGAPATLPLSTLAPLGYLCPKAYSTGSWGLYASGKVTVQVGGTAVPVQCGVTLTAVHSHGSAMPNSLAPVPVSALAPLGGLYAKQYSTGSFGWYAGGKVTLGGQQYQAGVLLTVVGSKYLPR